MNSIIFLICTHMSSFGFVCIFVTQSLRSGEIVSSVGLGITSGFSSISHSGQVPDGVCVRSTRTSGRQIAQVGRSPMLDPGGASSCWLELGCKRVDGSMPHKHWCSTFFLLCVLICFLIIFSLRDTKKS
uniref:Uncharacterized protein n=1 Tax=Triticum urartu TaxID=4572 RepID=A0A8R7R3C7_TRIUA